MMNRLFIGLLIFIMAMNAYGQPKTDKLCLNPAFDEEVRSWIEFSVPIMSTKDLSSSTDDIILLDAREIEEYNTSHIPGAHFIGYDKFKKKNIENIDKNAKIVVYCSIGYRSEKIGEKLLAMGFNQVYNLYGSIFEWANQGLPLEDKQGNVTKELHTYNESWSKWVDSSIVEKKW